MILLFALLLAQMTDNRVQVCDKANPTRCASVGADGKVAVAATVNVSGAADVVSAGAPTTFSGNGQCTGSLLLAGEQGAGFQLDSGATLVATLTPQYSLKDAGSDWTTTQFIDQNGSKSASIGATNPTTLSQLGIVLVTGARRVQVCTTAYTSGSGTGFAVAAYVQGGASAGGSSGLTDAQLRASAVAVSLASVPLPTGASTEATLALIKAKTDNLDVALSTRTKPADTQAVSAAALPLPAGASTSALQTTGNTSLSSIDGKVVLPGALDGSGNLKTHEQGTAAVSAASLPLPTGAATEATLALIKTDVDKIPASPSTDRTAAAGPFSVRLSDGAAFFDPRDISDRVGRALGVVSVTGSVAVTGTFWQATQPVSGTVAATQSGTWTVQPGNTANTTAWLVTGTGGTFPITAVSLPLPTGAASDATVAETHAVTLGSIPTRQDAIAGSDYGTTCNGGACSQIPRVDANGYQYAAVANIVRVQVAQPMNSLLQRCNAVRRTNCQP
jgi:hypothetical protein